MTNVNPEAQLHEQFSNSPWYHSVGRDQFGRLVVYVNYMCHDTLYNIPDHVGTVQVLVHFAASKTATREQFTNGTTTPPAVTAPTYPVDDIIDLTDEVEEDIEDLISELERLEKICGSNILQDIFYEIHDGKNAVTQLSTRYPDVAKSLTKLYNDYGFDVIYEEMDG